MKVLFPGERKSPWTGVRVEHKTADIGRTHDWLPN